MAKFRDLLTDRKMAIVFSMGFASGLPLLLTGSTLQAWFFVSHVDLHTIGLFSLVSLPYTLKFLWAPLLDRYQPPFLGRRRGWIAGTQVALMGAIVVLAFSDPSSQGPFIAVIATVLAFLSATQDIAIDGYRREILPTASFGFGNSLAITSYRLGMYLAGAGALIFADRFGFRVSYLLMAVALGFGLLTTLLASEPQLADSPPKSLREAVVNPFLDFFSKPDALWILAFIVLYKLGDNMATILITPVYQKLGFSLTEIGAVGKSFGIGATILGGLLGGSAMFFIGMRRSLWIFGIFQGTANLSFAWLAHNASTLPPEFHTAALAGAITVENLTAGMGTAAFTAFMASMTNKKYTATQYALLSSLMRIPGVVLGWPVGLLMERLGFESFFVLCTVASIPGLLLLAKISKWTDSDRTDVANGVS